MRDIWLKALTESYEQMVYERYVEIEPTGPRLNTQEILHPTSTSGLEDIKNFISKNPTPNTDDEPVVNTKQMGDLEGFIRKLRNNRRLPGSNNINPRPKPRPWDGGHGVIIPERYPRPHDGWRPGPLPDIDDGGFTPTPRPRRIPSAGWEEIMKQIKPWIEDRQLIGPGDGRYLNRNREPELQYVPLRSPNNVYNKIY